MKIFNLRYIVFFIIILGLVAFIVLKYNKNEQSEPKSFFDAASEQWDAEHQPWKQCNIPVPDGNLKVSFAIRQGHPFLAEFERKVILNGFSSDDVEIPIIYDSGCMTRVDVFWFSNNNVTYLKFDDGSWCVIDVKKGKVVFSDIDIEGSFVLRKKNNEYLESLDWKHLGLIKYDSPDYDDGLLFEEKKQ